MAIAAPARADAVPEPRARPARDCPRVFGSEVARESAREDRRDLLVWVDSGDDVSFGVHHAHWTAARQLRIHGVELVRTVPRSGAGRPVALVRLALDAAPRGCEPGLYAVRRDDFVGAHRAVLAVVDGALLLGDEDELLYLTATGRGPPDLRLVWRSPWRVAKPVETTGGTKRSKRKKRRKRGRRR